MENIGKFSLTNEAQYYNQTVAELENVGDKSSLRREFYCSKKTLFHKQLFDYHIQKMLGDDIIMPIDSLFAVTLVMCRKDNGKIAYYLVAGSRLITVSLMLSHNIPSSQFLLYMKF